MEKQLAKCSQSVCTDTVAPASENIRFLTLFEDEITCHVQDVLYQFPLMNFRGSERVLKSDVKYKED